MRIQQSLNGVWQFRLDPEDQGERLIWPSAGLPEPRPVEVPHIWQQDADHVHYCGAAWYEKRFTWNPKANGQRTFLRFDAVDFHARVWLNGTYVGEHEGGFTPFEFDVSDFIHADNSMLNCLTVRVYDPEDNAEIPIGKQGSWYTRVSGIWQDVYLESRAECFIKQVHVVPDIDRKLAQMRLQVQCRPTDRLRVNYTIVDHLNPQQVMASIDALVTGDPDDHPVPMPDATLWSPDHPQLYDVIVTLADHNSGDVLDQYRTYFGLREISYEDGQLFLNGQPLFIRGALDQAYYPDTIYKAPSDEWICKEIRLAKQMGFNLLRKHIKIEVPRYLYWADRMGMLIWAEPPNTVKWTAQSRRRFASELRGMIQRDFNRPSILIWSLYNEEWGLEWDLANDQEKQAYVKRLYDEVKQLDPTRLICDNSGWIHVKTDINDYHRYFVLPEQREQWKQDLDQFVAGDQGRNFVADCTPRGEPVIVSEFGVWGLPSLNQLFAHYEGEPPWFSNLGDDTHREDFKSPRNALQYFKEYQLDRIFGNMEQLSLESQRRMFRSVKALIEEMRKRPQINGYVVTEFTDVEWETNGWLDFLRNPKAGFDQAASFNGSLVVMADGVKHNLWSREAQVWDVIISNHEMTTIQGELQWEIPGMDISGSIPLSAGNHAYIKLPAVIRFAAPVVAKPSFYSLIMTLIIDGEIAARNEVELTVSPHQAATIPSSAPVVCAYQMDDTFRAALAHCGIRLAELESAQVVVTSVLDETVLEYYRKGGHVLFLAEEGDELTDKGLFTFRRLAPGESWDRASSFHYVDAACFAEIPLHRMMGWEMEGLFPDYIVPFSNYHKLGGTIGRIVYMFGNQKLADTSRILAGYFQGWIGQAGGSMLIQKNAGGSLTLTTWKLKHTYGTHPIATQLVNALIAKAANGF